MTDDKGVQDMLGFLLARDTMHQNQWIAAIKELEEKEGVIVPGTVPPEYEKEEVSHSLYNFSDAADDPVIGAIMGGMNPHHAIVSGLGAMPENSTGVPWNAGYIVASGNLLADLRANVNAESQGRLQVAQEILGGQYGEISVAMQYLFQGWNTRGNEKYKDLLMDTAAEEIGHVEMIATMIARLLEDAPVYEQENALLWFEF
ncbi:hypothetical protein DT075_06715 [Bacillus licheniformis]|nr:hypothetical protein DT075_06715 [Bacillus licheniformis]